MSSNLTIDLPRDKRAGHLLRELIDRALLGELGANAVGTLKILGSELVNNAVVHGEGAITAKVHVADGRARIEVVDEGSGNTPEVEVEPEPGEDGGWGLRMVDGLSTRWGVFEGTTHVWCELDLQGPYGPPAA